MVNWKVEAIKYQQSVYDMFGDREFDAVERGNEDLLKKVICSMYGMPKGDNYDEYFGYTMEQYEKAIEVVTCINDDFKYGDKIFLNFIHLIIKLADSDRTGFICVFKFPEGNNPNKSGRIFLEVETYRKYEGFSDYLKNNKLPECEMCYPKYGEYRVANGKVIVDFTKSPACKILPKVADVTGALASIAGGAAVTASLFFPISTPFVMSAACVAAGGGAISTGRAISKLIDRGSHGESVSLKNSRARLLWIETILSSVSVVSTGVAAGTAIMSRSAGIMATIENTLSETLFTGSRASLFLNAVQNVVRFLECSGLILNTLGLAACIINLVEKCISRTLEPLDLAVLSLAVFFIANIVICSETAMRLIQKFATSDSAPFQMTKYVNFQTVKYVKNLCFDSTPVIEIMVNGLQKVFDLFFNDEEITKILIDVSRNLTRLIRGYMPLPEFCAMLLTYLPRLVTIVIEKMKNIRKHLNENSCSFDLPSLNVPLKRIEVNYEEGCPLVQFYDKEFYLDMFYGEELDESYCMERVKLISRNELSDRTHDFKLYPGYDVSKAIVLINDGDEVDVFIFFYSRREDYSVFIMKAKAPSNTKIEIFENMKVNEEDLKSAKRFDQMESTNNSNELEVKLSKLGVKEERKMCMTEEKPVQRNLDSVEWNGVDDCMLQLENVGHLPETYLKTLCGEFGKVQMFSIGNSSALVLYQSNEESQHACKRLNGYNGISASLITDQIERETQGNWSFL